MSSTYLSPSLDFYKQVRSNNNGSVLADLAVSVSEKLVNCFCFSALCYLACFSNTRFRLLYASAPIPVSLQLGNGVVRLKYWGTHLEKNNNAKKTPKNSF